MSTMIRIKALIICSLLFVCSVSSIAQNNTTYSSIDNKPWHRPDYATLQFAGNIGYFSAGVGYKLLNDHLYTELLYGYTPPAISKAEKIHTITIKNTFPILTKNFKGGDISPIAGFTGSFETGNNSYLKLPDKYPEGYYVTNAFHFTLFVGAMLHKDFDMNVLKGVDFYVELGTVESYLWYAITSKEVLLNDIFSTAIGMNFYF